MIMSGTPGKEKGSSKREEVMMLLRVVFALVARQELPRHLSTRPWDVTCKVAAYVIKGRGIDGGFISDPQTTTVTISISKHGTHLGSEIGPIHRRVCPVITAAHCSALVSPRGIHTRVEALKVRRRRNKATDIKTDNLSETSEHGIMVSTNSFSSTGLRLSLAMATYPRPC